MKPENIGSLSSQARTTASAARGPVRRRARGCAARQPGEQVEDEDQRDDEEADRPAVSGGRPVVAVVGEQDPEPARGDADRRRRRASRASGRLVSRSAVAAGPISSAVERIVADRDRGERDGEREREQVAGADQTHRDAAGRGELGADRAQQQRAVERQHQREREQRRARAISGIVELEIANSEPNRIVTVAPVVLDVGRVEVEEQRREAEPGAEHDPGREVAPARALDADQLHRAPRRPR